MNENENERIVKEIQGRIEQLHELSGTDLKTEMDDLKSVLIKNPVACSLLLPEDIGEMVKHIKSLMAGAKAFADVKKPAGRGKQAAPQIDLSLDLSMEGF